jgi:8-amino-7-oxononanoate synthase
MVRPIVSPTVPVGTERVRVCLHAGNSVKDVEGLVMAVEEWVRLELELENKKQNGKVKAIL